MCTHEVRRECARPDHHQMRGILAREIFGGERRSGRRAPRREGTAIDHGQRLAGAARHQQIGAEYGGLFKLEIARKHRHQLATEKFFRPRRHDQQRGVGASLRNPVMMAHRHFDLATECVLERFDQSRIGHGARDVVAADGAHGREPVQAAGGGR
jgi:hypothetical protein